MEASGNLIVPGKRLGLRPRDKTKPVVKLTWVRGRPPTVPPVVDHFAGWDIRMLGNDRYGDCGPVSVANHRAMATTFLTGVTDYSTLEEVLDLYKRSGNPTFDPRTGRGDNGVSMDVLMDAAFRGGIGGDKELGYAALADTSDESIAAAIDLFGGVLFAVDLQTSQQRQTEQGYWDYAPGRPWGGHAIVAASYDVNRGRVDVGTWAKRVYTTTAFRNHQLSEVWLPLWPELVTSGKLFDAAVDWQGLVANWQAITGRPFPVPTPTPVPPPTPTPTPGEEQVCIYPATRQYRVPAGWTQKPG